MLKHLLPLTFLALCLAQAQDITGEWHGSISTPDANMRFALHIGKTGNSLKATLDAVDQGVSGIPVDSIKLADSRLSFTFQNGKGTFEGKLDPTGTVIEGMIGGGSGSAPITFRRGAVAKIQPKPATLSDIDGDWTGTLRDAGQDKAVVIHIANTADGLVATLDQPSQNVIGAPASSVQRNGSSLSIMWNVFGSDFEAKISEDRTSIEGAVLNGGNNYPITLRRKP